MIAQKFLCAAWHGTLPLNPGPEQLAVLLTVDGVAQGYNIQADNARNMALSILGYLDGTHRPRLFFDLDPKYFFDDYPREGCSFECARSRHGGYMFRTFCPQGGLISSHAPAADLKTVMSMARIWSEGWLPYPDGTPAHENNFRRNPDCLQPPVAPQRPKTGSAETPPGPSSECSI